MAHQTQSNHRIVSKQSRMKCVKAIIKAYNPSETLPKNQPISIEYGTQITTEAQLLYLPD